jgi:hypothetical protein
VRTVFEVRVEHAVVRVEEQPRGCIAGEVHEVADRFVEQQHLRVDRDVDIGHRCEQHRDRAEAEIPVSAQECFKSVRFARVYVDDRLIGVDDVTVKRVQKCGCAGRYSMGKVGSHRTLVYGPSG